MPLLQLEQPLDIGFHPGIEARLLRTVDELGKRLDLVPVFDVDRKGVLNAFGGAASADGSH